MGSVFRSSVDGVVFDVPYVRMAENRRLFARGTRRHFFFFGKRRPSAFPYRDDQEGGKSYVSQGKLAH